MRKVKDGPRKGVSPFEKFSSPPPENKLSVNLFAPTKCYTKSVLKVYRPWSGT